MKPFFISDNFYADIGLCFMIVSFDYLAKTTFSYYLQNFVSICNMIMLYQNIAALIVIKAIVMAAARTHPFLSVRSDKIDIIVVGYF